MPIKTSNVYDTFWRFAAERQSIYMKRVHGLSRPWTDDPILDTYKFTNAYRASDRTSQYLIEHVIYEGDQSPVEVFFRTILFKMFNRIDTWQWFLAGLDDNSVTTYDFYRGYIFDVLDGLINGKTPVYTSAYMTPSPPSSMGTKKHLAHLNVMQQMLDDHVPEKLHDTKSMKAAYDIMKEYAMIGPFLAYQFVTDLAYSDAYDWSEMEFTTPGPGAIDGIHKCFEDLGNVSPPDIIRMVAHIQQHEFNVRGLDFQTLWGRPLQLIDIQNLFCEISKYARVAHPEVRGKNDRTNIKAKHTGERELDFPFYPPKWGLSELIRDDLTETP